MALKRMVGKSASGLDDVLPLLLKKCGKQARQVIQDAVNAIPQSWTVSRTRVLKKRADKALPESYRPITVTSALHRLFEVSR